MTKNSKYDQGKFNRGLITWTALLAVCGFISFEGHGWVKYVFYVYLGLTLLAYLMVYSYNLARKGDKSLRKAAIAFMSEIGGGF
jgi:hypothetical protein